MAREERKRQKKLERKRAKRREALARLERRNPAGWPSQELIGPTPVHECWFDPNLFDTGIGQALIARAFPNGQLAVGVFLLDTYCLGIKNAFAVMKLPSELRELVHRMKATMDLVPKAAAHVKKLILELETWARNLGFAPHPDYQQAKTVLAGIDTSACSEQFTFGKDGKPFYVSGPFDRPFRVNGIMQTLMRTCGEGNFNYLVGVGGSTEIAEEFHDNELEE